MVVFESPRQGTDKSTALATLAVNRDWFADSLQLGSGSKEVIEHLTGKWIVEFSELTGIRKNEVEAIKAFLSRQTDRARLAYGRFTTERPRNCVFFRDHELNPLPEAMRRTGASGRFE
jgi:predicted P-loop ATPase